MITTVIANYHVEQQERLDGKKERKYRLCCDRQKRVTKLGRDVRPVLGEMFYIPILRYLPLIWGSRKIKFLQNMLDHRSIDKFVFAMLNIL